VHIPEQLLNDLRSVPGFDEASFVAAHAQPAVVSVRINPYKDVGVYADAARVPWCAQGKYLEERPVFTLDPAYHAGAYYVQEASSMFVAHVLEHTIKDRKGLRVLDLCAAPGGKSTLVAGMLDPTSLLVSNEVIRTRASILEENMLRWGYMNTWVASNDPRDFGKLEGYFDVIVVDAPCSGSGLWRKDERALDEWSEANVQLCGERQQRILADVWPALKEGGLLIYATCSYSPQEDEEILDWLAETYAASSVAVPVPESWGITPSQSKKGMQGYRFFPGKVKGEGFFLAAVQKNEATDEPKPVRYKPGNDKKIQQAAGYLLADDNAIFLQHREEYVAIRPEHERDMHLLQKAVYLRRVGMNLGTPAGKEWVPAHDVALSIDANKALPVLKVSREQALRYLKREDMGITDVPKGWMMIQYEGLGLAG
jgi:16S rRNA C967 or C1407 C5-methylase (RsmB/RsmF family)/NOL1/NOP2/fmu family ribosome biogenesis protein